MGYFLPRSAAAGATLKMRGESLHYNTVMYDSEVTMKELDFGRLLAMGKANLLQVGEENKTRLLSQLEQDLTLLKRHSFMDYRYAMIIIARVASWHLGILESCYLSNFLLVCLWEYTAAIVNDMTR